MTSKGPGAADATPLRDFARGSIARAEAVAAVLHAIEGLSEREVFRAYGIAGDDLAAVLDETGTPAGWHPLVEGYDAIPPLPAGLDVSPEVLTHLEREPRSKLTPAELSEVKARLRRQYEAGPGAKVGDEGDEASADDEDDQESEPVSGGRIPIPAETFLEELAQKLEVHPISVYWLLRQLEDQGGVDCAAEVARVVEDYLSVMILRLLGHRWPREVESGANPAPWTDSDGIIPITEVATTPNLVARIRERIAEDFGSDNANAVERDFREIVGKSLAEWVAVDFFARHISEFKKRPIAWHVQSRLAAGAGGKKGKKKAGGPRRAVFSCLLYYHRLDAGILPKLQTHFVRPLRARLQTELGDLEKVEKRTADQDARRVELELAIEELRDFDARLDQVMRAGFACPDLERLAGTGPLDRWTSRDGRAAEPAAREVFLAQGGRYEPDLNDGVGVNIAPLQRAGLLAAEVIAAKDVERAIANRAAWRADERRWCREGKLPRPGWWSMDERAAAASPALREDSR